MAREFLPTTWNEGAKYYKDFSGFDVVFVSGDAYYDHPLSGVAILARLLDSKGYRVGIIAQPQKDADYTACGRPKYFFCITSGMLDSMLANYTPMLRKRENVLVPERALMVYTQKVKQAYKGCITVLGGVEATLRRFTHFDYRTNALRRGILNDTKADLLLFGNAERSLLTILSRMRSLQVDSFDAIREALDLSSIDGVAYRAKKNEIPEKVRRLPSYEDCVADKQKFNLLTRVTWLLPESAFLEPCGLGSIMHNRAAHPLTDEEMDRIYDMQFTRTLHPNTKNRQMQIQMVDKLRNSVVIGRGCWGSCTFCVIPIVQGKHVARRSRKNIVKEVETLYMNGAKMINDLTLPTLNMYGSSCALYNSPETIFSPVIEREITVYNKKKYCNQQCVGCPERKISDDLLPLLKDVEALQKKYRGRLELRSAVRHDIILEQQELFRKIMQFTTRLKIAPEHISDTVLKQMNKSEKKAFVEFLRLYASVNREQKTNKKLVPYFVAAHPGTTMDDMEILKKFCDEKDIYVNLTQVFTPTPGTVSTAMYYSGGNPLTKEKVYVPRTFREKKDQKNILLGRERADEEFEDENG